MERPSRVRKCGFGWHLGEGILQNGLRNGARSVVNYDLGIRFGISYEPLFFLNRGVGVWGHDVAFFSLAFGMMYFFY